ncbi:MAG: hypothetical protein J1D86_03095 [Alistipes sp.]|nr:hypothetical protein [Alistipes sp.]
MEIGVILFAAGAAFFVAFGRKSDAKRSAGHNLRVRVLSSGSERCARLKAIKRSSSLLGRLRRSLHPQILQCGFSVRCTAAL